MSKEAVFVKLARVHAGMSQGDLSKKLGFSNPQFVSNIERSQSTLPPKRMRKFVKATGASLEDFVMAKVFDFEVHIRGVVK